MHVSPKHFVGHCRTTYSLSDETVTTTLDRMIAGGHFVV